jgi:hypothetical protein
MVTTESAINRAIIGTVTVAAGGHERAVTVDRRRKKDLRATVPQVLGKLFFKKRVAQAGSLAVVAGRCIGRRRRKKQRFGAKK